MGKKKANWYIKKGDRTLGPITQEKLEEALRTQQLTGVDRISEKGKPWKPVRDFPQFAELLKDLKNQRNI